MSHRTIGILGGMGPEATIDLQRRILNATPARDDHEHVRVLVDNNPHVPSRIEAVIHGRGESPVPTLVAMAQGLERQGADFLIMPCNTAHLYAEAIAGAVTIEFVSLLQCAVDASRRRVPALSRVGLLASTAVHQARLYEQPFGDVSVLPPAPALQDGLMQLILRVKANATTPADDALLNRVAEDLAGQNADCLLIACTELSVLEDRLTTPLPVVDASQALAEVAVDKALDTNA